MNADIEQGQNLPTEDSDLDDSSPELEALPEQLRRLDGELARADVSCVGVTEEPPEWAMYSDVFFEANDAGRTGQPKSSAEHPAPPNRCSRSRFKADAGCTIDQHTAAVLIEIGISEDRVAELKQQKMIGL